MKEVSGEQSNWYDGLALLFTCMKTERYKWPAFSVILNIHGLGTALNITNCRTMYRLLLDSTKSIGVSYDIWLCNHDNIKLTKGMTKIKKKKGFVNQ